MEYVVQGDMLVLLFFVALLAGFIDAIAGGGGLITIPTLLLLQLPPILTLGTNKLQSCAGSLTASIAMLRKRQFEPRTMVWPFLAALVGATLGTLAVQRVNPKALDAIVPVILIGIGLYFLLSPKIGVTSGKPRIGDGLYRFLAVPAIGFYDGFFGPGTGSFFALVGVSLRGQALVPATAVAKLLNFATNVASLLMFIAGGKVLWTVGLVMMAGQVAGAYGGAHLAVRGGARIIRPMIVFICFAMVIRYFWQKGFLSF